MKKRYLFSNFFSEYDVFKNERGIAYFLSRHLKESVVNIYTV